jgi:hypothetical protein
MMPAPADNAAVFVGASFCLCAAACQDASLLYIAEQALTAPCPDGWTVHLDSDGNEFFYNPTSQASTYEHPMDQHFRKMYNMKKLEQQQQC